jgi:hypothetical protein
MADGDIAAAAGMDILAGTEDLRQSYLQHNKSRDLLATHQTVGTHPASAINSGTLADARIPALNASKISAGTLADARIPALNASKITAGVLADARIPALTAAKIPDLDGSKITTGEIVLNVNTVGSGRFGAAWNNNIVSTRRTVWMDANGQLGHTASSERYKTAIRRAELDPLTVLEIVDVVYYAPRMTAEEIEANGGKESTEVGVIAEQLLQAGLWEFVFFDEEGKAQGVHYDLLSLAAIVAIQHVWSEHKDLAQRVANLEKSVS